MTQDTQDNGRDMNNLIVSFSLFGKCNHFEDWGAAEEKERKVNKEMRHKKATDLNN